MKKNYILKVLTFSVKLQDTPNVESQNKINRTVFGYEVKNLNEK